MTPYSVEWKEVAEDQLATIWLQAPNPRDVTTAQAAVDALLARTPLSHGLEVQEGLRKIRVPPLTVFYAVDSDHSVVEVSAVAYTP